MKKIKDIFYDMNDILVAMIIIAAAALVITSNIDSILNYPSSIADEIQVAEAKTPTNYAENPPVSEPGGDDAISDQGSQVTTGAGISDQNATGGGVSGNPGAEAGMPVNYSVYIKPGSTGDQIADILVGVGLFSDRKEFNGAVTAAGAEGKLRAGTFIIPSNAASAEVISILTSR